MRRGRRDAAGVLDRARRLAGRAGRAWRGRHTPRRSALARAYLRGSGLEIGALNKPLKVPRGVRVAYVDRMDRAGLAAQYGEIPAERLVPVDIVDDGERLATVADGSQDFVIANHFLEHCEDPIGALLHHTRVLRPGGVLFLAIPDKRHTFDHDRPVTPLAHLIADHKHGPTTSRQDHLEEWAMLVDRVPTERLAERVALLDRLNYSIHYHVWTPTEVVELVVWLRRERGVPIEIDLFVQRADEMVLVLRKHSPA